MENAKNSKATSLANMAKFKIGNVSRRDKMLIPISMLTIEKGFNVRGIGLNEDEYWSQDHIQEHITNISYAYENGEYVPPIVVKFRPDDCMAVIRDGHHRYKALLLAVERGAGIEKVEVTEIKGDETTQQLLMLQSANQLELSPVEKAEIIHRLYTYGLEPQAIADKIRKSITYVNDMLKIYDLPLSEKRKIQMKEVSYSTAISKKRAENPEKVKRTVPPKKVVHEFMDILSGFKNSPVIDGKINVEIPVELLEKILENLPKTELEPSSIDINQNTLPFLDNEEE